MAAVTDATAATSATAVVALGGASMLKPRKSSTSQQTTAIRSVFGIEGTDWATSCSRRVLPPSRALSPAM